MTLLAETQELAQIIDRRVSDAVSVEAVRPGLYFARVREKMPRVKAVYRAALCVCVQGAKRVHVGKQTYRYDPQQYLVSTLTVPVECDVLVERNGEPLLSLALELDLRDIGKLIAETNDDGAPTAPATSMCGGSLDRSMARALVRLAETAQCDEEWRMLGQSAIREVHYRLLTGPAGPLLRDRVARSGTLEPVARAVCFIEDNLSEHLDVAAIAKAAAVSASGLHARFKEVTAQSPMQYVKRLRLEQAPKPARIGQLGHGRRLSRGLREHLTVQPGLPPSLRRATVEGTTDGGDRELRPAVLTGDISRRLQQTRWWSRRESNWGSTEFPTSRLRASFAPSLRHPRGFHQLASPREYRGDLSRCPGSWRHLGDARRLLSPCHLFHECSILSRGK